MSVQSETWLCAFGVLVAILLRSSTSLHSYSGQGKSPMFGDYEAQRHWMEVTVNLPMNQWYHNSSQNDLQYWGLDYPPLTAYHSYVCGLIASFINPAYVALEQSRGYESEDHKLFMRFTVLIVDLLLYVPSVIIYFVLTAKVYQKRDMPIKKGQKGETPNQNVRISTPLAIVLALFYPGMILIDHGHFQYNCVSLGFAVFAITFLIKHKNILASIFFCLALNYKQMELYHSLPFFLYLLSTCVPKPGQNTLAGIERLFKIVLTVLITFAIIWAPFLRDMNDLLQVVHRLFPVARGVFEDKVANVWCTLNIFYKFKLNFSLYHMVRYCTIATLVAILPSSADLFLRPNIRKFVPAVINSSLAFFLFSFQVHEKSILLAAVPVTLYSHVEPFPCFWFLVISLFSMFPLIVKDGLVIAFIALSIFYITTFHLSLEHSKGKSPAPTALSKFSFRSIVESILKVQDSKSAKMFFKNIFSNRVAILEFLKYVITVLSLLGCLVLAFLMATFDPPENYPDIFPLLISSYSCIHFLGFFLYFNVIQFKIPQALEDVRHIKLKGH